MAELVIIRGVPGSGKTTMAKRDFPNHVHVETDMFFIDKNGEYKFDGRKVKDAHKWCENTTMEYLLAGLDTVVTNTFTRLWEMEPYFNMGADNVIVIEAKGNFENIHGVPAEKVKAMRERFEEYKNGDMKQ